MFYEVLIFDQLSSSPFIVFFNFNSIFILIETFKYITLIVFIRMSKLHHYPKTIMSLRKLYRSRITRVLQHTQLLYFCSCYRCCCFWTHSARIDSACTGKGALLPSAGDIQVFVPLTAASFSRDVNATLCHTTRRGLLVSNMNTIKHTVILHSLEYCNYL